MLELSDFWDRSIGWLVVGLARVASLQHSLFIFGNKDMEGEYIDGSN